MSTLLDIRVPKLKQTPSRITNRTSVTETHNDAYTTSKYKFQMKCGMAVQTSEIRPQKEWQS